MVNKSIFLLFLLASVSISANHKAPPTPSFKIRTCYIQSKTGDKCLHQLGAIKDPNHLGGYTLYPCIDATNIHFTLIESVKHKGYYFIRDEYSKRCVHQFGANNNKLITQHRCLEGHDNILWKLIPDDKNPGYFYLRAKHSGQCLYTDPQDPHGVIVQMDCHTGPGALWRFTRAHELFNKDVVVNPFEWCLTPPPPPNSDL